MKAKAYSALLTLWLLAAGGARGQQIVCERLLTTPGLQVSWATACTAPNGEFIVTGAAQPTGANNSIPATHTFVARLQANGCDTLWQRRLPHSVTYYASSAVRATARSIWLLTLDTIITTNLAPPFKGARLWHLNAAGQVRRVVRFAPPTAREFPNFLLPAADGGVYAQVYNQLPSVGNPRAPGILRFDSTGMLRWRRDYGYAAGYYGSSLCYTPAGRVLLTGMVAVGTNYDGHVKLLEVEPSRGDSVQGLNLPWGPNVNHEMLVSRNDQPQETIALTSGGYALTSLVNNGTNPAGQLTRLDASHNVSWRYQLPAYGSGSNSLSFTQVRELADGTLLALVRSYVATRTFWLYRFNATTGTLMAVYPFTSGFGALQVYPAHLLPVAADSSLLVVGGTRVAGTVQLAGIYVARLRVPGLPRVVTPALPLAGQAATPALAFALFPNPARTVVTLELPAGNGPGQLELRGALGQLVRTEATTAGAERRQWALAGLSPGFYAVVWRGPGGSVVRRLLVE